MKLRRVIVALVLSGTFLSFSSCVDSETPICGPERTKADPGLIGTWRTKLDDGAVEYYHVAPAGDKYPPSILRCVAVIQPAKGTLKHPLELLAYPAVIDGNRYLNVAIVAGDGLRQLDEKGWQRELVKGYFILKYKIENDALTISAMDPDGKRQAIESQRILGRIGDNPVFTDATAKVAELLMSPQQVSRLFGKNTKTMQRIK